MRLHAPVSGIVVAMTEIPDPVFSTGMLGPCVALLPPTTTPALTVQSPVGGRVSKAMSHAAIVDVNGPEGIVHVLVHAGIDTSSMASGLASLVHLGETVTAGTGLIDMDCADVVRAGRSPHVIVGLIQEPAERLALRVEPGVQVCAGEVIGEIVAR